MLNLYKETAFELKPSASARRVDIIVPRANGSYDRSKFSKKIERHDRLASDDKSYAAEYLASSSAVFFRQSQTYPRSFLWRVVGKQKILEISNADFARHERDPEANNVLAFQFQDRITPRGLSICDSSKKDEFHVFVLTQENEVFEIHLHTDFFSNSEKIPSDTKSWCSPIRASSLSIDKAFRVHAANPQDVFVSFISGKVQHWRRGATDQPWSHVNYDDKTWGLSLFSIVSRKGHSDIDFGGQRLAYNTAHAMARSGQYLFTACLNHTLRIWHLESGKLVESRDLLDQARDPQENIQLNPAEPGYIQFLEGANKNEQILLTYSPLDGGQVKLWRVRNSFEDETNLFSIEDMVPSSTLSLPDPDPMGNSVWSLAGLRAIFDKHTKDWQVWALWRNHNYHKTYTLNFSFADISNQWQEEWVTISTINTKIQGPDFVPVEAQEVTSKWLEYILFPGRYSAAVIETGLTQFATALDIRQLLGDRNKPLAERLTKTVVSQVKLRSYEDKQKDYDRYALETDQQWRHVWRILESMNEGRFAPLSLSLDPLTDMVVLTMADTCCLIRECSNLELLQTNQSEGLDTLPHIARGRWPYRKLPFGSQEASTASVVLAAVQKFFSSFPPELTMDFVQTLDEDLYTNLKVSTPERIVSFFNSIDFANAVPDDVEKEFLKELSSIGGLEAITNNICAFILKLVMDHRAHRGRPVQVKTDFGVQAMSTAVIDEILAIRQVLFSLLAVIIFVDESDHFDTSHFFEQIVERLKVQERNLWLATHHRSTTAQGSISVLQDLYGEVVRPQSTDHHPLPYVLTQHIKDNLDFISGEGHVPQEEAAVFLQCNLLKHGDVQLAKDFLKFQPSTPWSTYVKGRLDLALGDFKAAATSFRAASDGLAHGKAIGKLTELSSGFLTSDEAACFFGGTPLYLQHIVTLFEKHKAYSQAAEVAQLALQALKPDEKEPIPNFRQSVLLRLFTAELKSSRFDQAFDALVQFPDPVLQRTSTTDLIDTMLESSRSLSDTASVVSKIQDLPLDTQPHLAIHIDHHLASLAKKQTGIPSASGLWLSSTPIDYLSILHALRLTKKDYRGAVSVLFDRLRIIQKSGRARSDPQATSLRHALLAIINAMTCVKEDEAYIIVDTGEDPRGSAKGVKRLRAQDDDGDEQRKKRKRVIITLDDLRREYQRVLDRCSRIERGDFEFGEGTGSDDEDMDTDGQENDGTWEGSKLVIDRTKTGGALNLGNGEAMQLT